MQATWSCWLGLLRPGFPRQEGGGGQQRVDLAIGPIGPRAANRADPAPLKNSRLVQPKSLSHRMGKSLGKRAGRWIQMTREEKCTNFPHWLEPPPSRPGHTFCPPTLALSKIERTGRDGAKSLDILYKFSSYACLAIFDATGLFCPKEDFGSFCPSFFSSLGQDLQDHVGFLF